MKEAIDQKDNVIIVTDRNCEWPFFKDNVSIYDFTQIFGSDYKKRVSLNGINAFRDYLKYRSYISHLKKVVTSIVKNEDFIFYMPSMAKDITAAFAYNKHCKGYYYVDEGSLAYMSQDLINQRFTSNFKNSLRRLLKIEDHFHYEVLSTFKGTISITKEAFSWNKKYLKIINPINEYVNETRNNLPSLNSVIVTGLFSEDINIIIAGIVYTVDNILSKGCDSRIGIKLHPYAITNNRDKTLKILQYIKDKYKEQIIVIPNEISIEAMSLVYHPRLYSLFTLSSIILYGLLLKSSDGYLIDYENETFSIVGINSVEEFYRINSIVNYKDVN